ncbi:MAG TPA: hypothetical protein V6D22_04285 [Candidatus Obscuribacterales bacterium]
MGKRLLVAALVTGLACLQLPSWAGAEHDEPGYAGLEFYGSSQVSKSELEKEARLKPGADLKATLKAASRLKEELENRRIQANIDVASEQDKLYITVDVMEDGAGASGRKLTAPHHVYLTDERPLSLLEDMSERAQKLAAEGRTYTRNFQDGIEFFSDEPLNQLALKLQRCVPPIRNELFQVIGSDPDPARRSAAVELLNWDSNPVRNCYDLTAALEDGSAAVRAKVDRYLLPRLSMLPDNFPIQNLVEAYSRQLTRPSYVDRAAALQGLLAIVKAHPFAAGAVKVANEDKLQQLVSMSVLTSIKQPAQQLLEACHHIPELPKPQKRRQLNEF